MLRTSPNLSATSSATPSAAPRRSPVTVRSLLASVALLAAGTSCQSAAQDIDDHWNFRSVPPRVARHLLGYDAARDGSYRDFQWQRKQDINLTLRRYFLNDNPENPFQEFDPSLYEGRPVHSILPNPLRYIHLEGVLLGWAITGAGGVFFPIPLDSLIGSFEEGGGEEFSRGISASLSGKGVLTASDTPAMYAAGLENEDVNSLTRM